MSRADAIAIVGMACRFADAPDVQTFWKNLTTGHESLRTYSPEELRQAGVPAALLDDPHYVPVGAPLDDMTAFDAAFFGFSPREAAILDPQHRHFLETCWSALEAAGHDPARFDGRVGVYGGSGHNSYLAQNLLDHPELLAQEGYFLLRHTGNDKDFLTTRVSYLFDLRGPSVGVQTACSTSLVAVHLAAQGLLAGECDLALAGGVTIELPHGQGYLHKEGEILSHDGHCRAFDAHSTGTVFGSGVGVVVLRRLDEALADGDHIHAVILGSAVNNDGASKVGYLAPSVEGQVEAAREAVAVADIDPGSVTLIEAHGTGTRLGDPIEVASLSEVYPARAAGEVPCALGSVKTNIGHTDVAAGVASLIKAALAVEHGLIPASLNFTEANPAIDFASTPFYVPQQTRVWPAQALPRRAAVHSLGVGGTNAHVVLEEPPGRPESPAPPQDSALLLLSARSAPALKAAQLQLAQHLEAHPQLRLADVAHSLRQRRDFAYRRSIYARSLAGAAQQLRAQAEVPPTRRAEPSKTVFLFAGAGVQHPRMGLGLYRRDAAYRAALDECHALLEGRGLDLLGLLQDEAQLARARPSQVFPALVATQYAAARMMGSWGVAADALIGHSLGEYTAATLAGVFSLPDVLKVMVGRGELFEQCESAGMTSVYLPEHEVLRRLHGRLGVSVINSPELTVVGGPLAELAEFERALEQEQIDYRRLPLAGAGHSAVLDPVIPEFRALLKSVHLRPATLPIASNLTGGWLTPEQAADPEYWVTHLRAPLRFSDGLETVAQLGAVTLLELSPGAALTRTIRTHPSAARMGLVAAMRARDDQADDFDVARAALGQLWEGGVKLEWLHEPPGRRVPLPTYPFERQPHWFAPRAPDVPSGPPPADVTLSVPSWRLAPLPHGAEGPAALNGWPLWSVSLDSALNASLAEVVRAGQVMTLTPAELLADPAQLDRQLAASRPGLIIYHAEVSPEVAPGVPGAGPGVPADFQALVALLQALTRRAELWPVALLVVTQGAQQVSSEGLSSPCQATLLGPTRVAPNEISGLRMRLLDWSGVPAELASQLLAELADLLHAEPGNSAALVARRGTRRYAEDWSPLGLDRSGDATPWREHGTYLIIGGLGDLGFALAERLARRQPVNLALLSRQPLPPRASWPGLLRRQPHGTLARRIQRAEALEHLGASVEVVATDLTSAESVAQALQAVLTRFGSLHGVIHAAGQINDGLLTLQDMAEMRPVIEPKIGGTLNLLTALASCQHGGLALDFVALYSSVSGLIGLPGQTAYCAANAGMDALAAWGRSQGLPVSSVNWGPWSGTGIAERLYRNSGWQPLSHRVFEFVRTEAQSVTYRAKLDAQTDWMVNEHRTLAGQAVLPGAGYLAWVHAALEEARPERAGQPLRLGDVVLLAPLVVGERGRDLRITLQDAPDGALEWTISTPSGGIHAQGRAVWIAQAPRHTSADLEEALALSAAQPGEPLAPHRHMQFGPSWEVVVDQRRTAQFAVTRLELPPTLQEQLEAWPLHPALLDMATGGSQLLIPAVQVGAFFVPVSYDDLTIYHPLAGELISVTELLSADDEQAAMNVTVYAGSGQVLLELCGFRMRRVSDDTLTTAETSDLDDRVPQLAQATTPAQGIAALEQILLRAPGQYAVSRQSIASLREQANAPQLPAQDTAEQGGGLPLTLAEQVQQVWCALLGLESAPVNVPFSDLGGHSLLLIRAVTRVREVTGLRLPLNQAFAHPTIEEWLTLLEPQQVQPSGEADSARSSGPPADEPLPLAPSMLRFLHTRQGGPVHQWNIAQLLELRIDLTPGQVERAARQLLERHDALRSALTLSAQHWEYRLLPLAEVEAFRFLSLVEVPPDQQPAAISAHASALQESFELERGGLLRVVYMDLGRGQPPRILLAVHHLAADALSWSILLADFQESLARQWRGDCGPPAPVTTTFAQWLRRLQEHASREETAAQVQEYVRRFPARPVPLPVSGTADPARNINREARSAEVTLPAPLHRALRGFAQAHHVQEQDLLIAALGQALGAWSAAPEVLIDVLAQGREEDLLGVDVAQTVGFFVAYLPLVVSGLRRPLNEIAAEVERWRTHPAAFEVDLLRYLSPDPAQRSTLRRLARAQVLFNFIGQRHEFGSEGLDPALLAPAAEASGSTHAPEGRRDHLIAVKVGLASQGIQVTVVYSQAIHDEAAVLALIQAFRRSLEAALCEPNLSEPNL